MPSRKTFTEDELAQLAKEYREASGLTRTEASRRIGVSLPSIFNAEERPELSLAKLRIRMIEVFGNRRVVGPRYWLEKP